VVILDSPATWREQPSPAAADVMTRFTTLDGQVRRARIRRVLWTTAGVLGVGGSAVGAALLLEKALLGALT
jgi:hypothetical protein